MPLHDELPPIWERPEPAKRPKPSQLSREKIVNAAIAIADTEGLANVSVRKVAAALRASPMRLYSYISTKEELLDLLVDTVYGEMAPQAPLPNDWQEALRVIAHRIREASQRHPWLLELLGGRPHQGPKALAHLESVLGTLNNETAFADIQQVVLAAMTFHSFVIGALQREASERRAEQDSGMSKAEWKAMAAPYMERMLATNKFPTLRKLINSCFGPPEPNKIFNQGLDCVLEGIASRLKPNQ